MTNPYPSIDELIPPSLEAKIPGSLYKDIANRYITLGGNYLTEFLTVDGRPINGMMYTDRISNALEEVIDACFCVIGWIFRSSVEKGEIPESAYIILDGLIQIYSLLVAEKVIADA